MNLYQAFNESSKLRLIFEVKVRTMRSENLFTRNLNFILCAFQEFDCAFEIVGPGFLDVTWKGSERAIRFWC